MYYIVIRCLIICHVISCQRYGLVCKVKDNNRTDLPIDVLLFGENPQAVAYSAQSPSVYVGVVEKPPPPPLTGEQYGKMELKYPEGGHCQSVLRPQGFLTSPFILNNSMAMPAPFNVVSYPRCCEPRN